MISSRYIKIFGNFEIPEDLKNGCDYKVSVVGGIVARTEKPDEMGGTELEYRFRPLTGEIIDEVGKSIQMSDRLSNSQKMRMMIVRDWGYEYDIVMRTLLANKEELRALYEKLRN